MRGANRSNIYQTVGILFHTDLCAMFLKTMQTQYESLLSADTYKSLILPNMTTNRVKLHHSCTFIA